MDTNAYIEIYRVLIVIAFIMTATTWLGYTVLAPWYKSAWGRIIWIKFLSTTLVLSVPFLLVTFKDVPFRYEASIIAMCLFIIAYTSVGYGIYTTQIRGYLSKRKQARKDKKESNATP